MSTEADTCRKFVVPKLQAAGWDNDPHSIAEQRFFTDGRIVVRGIRAERRKGKRADYLLRYTRDFTLAVVEAKAEYKKAADGLQQAKDYAQILGLKFAYASNGGEIIEFDFITGIERSIKTFPTPADLWARHRGAEKLTDDTAAQRLLTPANLTTGREPRYYQRIAIDRAVQFIVQGRKRVLLTMATGTGKTDVAFQICWKLWSSKWNAKGDPTRKPRILYLSDRNFLVDDPKDKIFSAFGDARHKIEGGNAVFSREMYFATYQSIAKDERRPGLYKSFAPDFFDLIIVDECHRGSAKEDSNWREILEYFEPAYQLGMTATPKREDNRDTYLYFGNPIYTYSLKQGIDDGFLAPYRVHRIVTQWDAAGWRPSKDDLDRYGREIPDEVYTTADFERRVALRARTQAVARHLTDFLKKTDRFAKTIVFCVDQEHASEMRTALNNLNADLVQQFPDYVCRVTADEGDIGRGHMQRFQDVETRTPVILTTSQLLTTGLDAPTCRNVVLVRLVNSMVEFKQIIGRGTRVRDDYGKLWFNILNYTGTATRNFADPAFDGDPAFATQEEIDEYGKVKETEVITPEEPESETAVNRRRAVRTLNPQPSTLNQEVLLRRRPGGNRRRTRSRTRCRRQTVAGGQTDGLHGGKSAFALRPCGRPARPLGGCRPARRHHPATGRARDRFSDRRGAGGQAGGRPVRPAVSSGLQRAGAHPPPARRPPEAAARCLLQILCAGSPRNSGRPAGEIRQRRRTAIHLARRAESPAHFRPRQRQ